MNKDTMIQALVNLYDRRLRKLLYYDQEHYTCKLIERMFCRFDELTEQGHRRYAANINRYIGAILEHNEERSKQVESILALHEIRTLLELYIKSTIVEFWPVRVPIARFQASVGLSGINGQENRGMSEKTSEAVPPATQYRCACPAVEAYYRGAEQENPRRIGRTHYQVQPVHLFRRLFHAAGFHPLHLLPPEAGREP